MLSDRDLAGIGVHVCSTSISIVTFVTNDNIWITRCLSLANTESPWSCSSNTEQIIEWSYQSSDAIGLEQNAAQDWASFQRIGCCGLGVRENCCVVVNSSSCCSGIVSIIFVSQTNGSQGITIWPLGHLPGILSDGRTTSVGAGDADNVFITGINVLLGGDGTGRGIDDQVATSVISSTSINFERACCDGSA